MRWLVATFLLSEKTTLPGSLRSQHRISGSYIHTYTHIIQKSFRAQQVAGIFLFVNLCIQMSNSFTRTAITCVQELAITLNIKTCIWYGI